MKAKHKLNIDAETPSTSSSATSKILPQSTLLSMNKSKKDLGPDAYNKLNKALALMLTLDNRPLSLVLGEGFC